MPKSPEQSIPETNKNDDIFFAKLNEIERQIVQLDATRNQLDRDSKLGAMAVIEKLRVTQDTEKRRRLISDLGSHVAMFDASKNNLDRNVKLEALRMIGELE